MKHVAIYELSKDGYRLFVEPSEPPLPRLDWADYRPDVVGIDEAPDGVRIALVECETCPRIARIQEKLAKIASLTLQTRLNERHRFRPILVIPPRTLHRILYPGLRRFWELWIVNRRGRYVEKIPAVQPR
jgi:hypothetical protein